MLAERHVRLLTAYVDGELPSGQRRRLARLLRRSKEARALLRQLQGDSQQLRALPAVAAPADLSGSVLAAIGQSRPRPAPRPRLFTPTASSFPTWTGWAAAAAVLLVVGIGSFLIHLGTAPQGSSQPASQQTAQDRDKGRHETPGSSLAKQTDPSGKAEDDDSLPPGPGNMVTDAVGPPRPPRKSEQKAKQPQTGTSKPSSDNKPEGPVFASPSHRQEGSIALEQVDLALPVVHQLAELDQPEKLRKLRDQVTAGSAFRIELLARDATRGFERVRRAAAGQKLALVIDPAAADRLRKPQWRTDYALFAENLTPANVIALLQGIARADRQAAAKKSVEQRFNGSLVVKELAHWDRKELTQLLGIDPVRVRPAAARPQAGLDIRRPLSEQTSTEVTAALAGKGVARPGKAQPQQSAIVLRLSGSRVRSVALRRFLDERQPAKPGTVQVLLVLRSLPH